MKEFPVHSGSVRKSQLCPRAVPWDMVIEHEQQAQRNHSQTVQRLAERGGLGIEELYFVLRDERFTFSNVPPLMTTLAYVLARVSYYLSTTAPAAKGD